MSCQFSFGPDRSYFCSGGSTYAWSDKSLPPELARILEDKAHPQALDHPYDVAFPIEPTGGYLMCWKAKRGEKCYEDGSLGPSYARLARFTKAVITNDGHSRTVFGPNSSFFSISSSGFCWQNLPPELEDNIQSCNKLRQPVYVALGVEGTYIVMYSDGTMVFDLCGQYPLLQTIIMEKAHKKRGLMYCALNPFVAGEYYAVYGDGGSTWCLHSTWSADVKTVSLRIKELLGDPPTTPTAPPSPMYAPPPVYAPPATPVYAAPPVIPIYMTPPPPVVVQAAPANESGHKMKWQEGVLLGLKATSIIMGMPIWPLFGN
ncbi:hypothetical protein K438DRAFT_1810544 [Mycena galopus ATCC 62051]|nr:hypothetical protein K438DRAFT_1810544 [Mycena galopus ATCC 62051]